MTKRKTAGPMTAGMMTSQNPMPVANGLVKMAKKRGEIGGAKQSVLGVDRMTSTSISMTAINIYTAGAASLG